MDTLSLEVHITPGKSAHEAVHEMVRLANTLQITIKATFNDHRVIVCPGELPEVHLSMLRQVGQT